MDGDFSPAMMELFGDISAFMGVDILDSLATREDTCNPLNTALVQSARPPTRANIQRASRTTKRERARGMGSTKKVVVEGGSMFVTKVLGRVRNPENTVVQRGEQAVVSGVNRQNRAVTSFDDLRRLWVLEGGSGQALESLVRRAALHRKASKTVGVAALVHECVGVLRFGRHEHLCMQFSSAAVAPIKDLQRWPLAQTYLAGQTPILALEVVSQCVLIESMPLCENSVREAAAAKLTASALDTMQSWHAVTADQLIADGFKVRQFVMPIL